jgi:hypothetical protein
MTFKERAARAQLLFKRKQEQLIDAPIARLEYEQRASLQRENIVRLRALRLARDAKLSARQKQPVK